MTSLVFGLHVHKHSMASYTNDINFSMLKAVTMK